MEIATFHEALQHEAAALAAAARRAPLSSPVPSCPGWSLADLVHHTGEVLAFWTAIVRDEIDDPDRVERSPRPADADLLPWFVARADEASLVLRTSDPAAPCWTWSDQHDVAFVIRRMAHEVAMHRWDAELAAGEPLPIDAALASDGIDELLEHFASWPWPDRDPIGGTVHIHCTDVAGEWLVVPDGPRLAFTREHAKGACALRGPASDLLLALWRRLPVTHIEVIGDAAVADEFLAWTFLD